MEYGDNDACSAFVKDPVLHGRMKHIDIAYHVVKDYQADGHILAARVDTADNIADSLTKPTGHPTYARFCSEVIVFDEFPLALEDDEFLDAICCRASAVKQAPDASTPNFRFTCSHDNYFQGSDVSCIVYIFTDITLMHFLFHNLFCIYHQYVSPMHDCLVVTLLTTPHCYLYGKRERATSTPSTICVEFPGICIGPADCIGIAETCYFIVSKCLH